VSLPVLRPRRADHPRDPRRPRHLRNHRGDPRGRGGEQAERVDLLAEIERLNRRLAGYLDGWRARPAALGDGFAPLADVEETDDGYVVEVELPGVKKDDIEIEVAGRCVWVRGRRREKERTGLLRRQERVVGRFSCEVILPVEVDDAEVHATLDEGVLTMRVPKPAHARRRRIPIR
jgi:HSP20 family protein